jgi:hypothetical protein
MPSTMGQQNGTAQALLLHWPTPEIAYAAKCKGRQQTVEPASIRSLRCWSICAQSTALPSRLALNPGQIRFSILAISHPIAKKLCESGMNIVCRLADARAE